jgi:histidyl-tRNA synthetase
MAFKAPRGTNDLLPQQARALEELQGVAALVFARYGYELMETPLFEQLDVFVHGIGQATDVVGKEMFRVLTPAALARQAAGEKLRSEELLALRPEQTAGIARAAVQHGLVPPDGTPVKLWYKGSMFRAERPQMGRLREFHQIGAECLGAPKPTADAESILMLMSFLGACGVPSDRMRLLLNSMGDAHCRPAWREQVRSFILEHADSLCPECQRRADTNPLRAFDCKNESCQHTLEAAPRMTDMLCPECAAHYAEVKSLLDAAGQPYAEDFRLVRGLDYYTRTVFEVKATTGLGSQDALGGGGRYDGLLEGFGGRPTPGLGFAVGLERVQLLLDAIGHEAPAASKPVVYVAAAGEGTRQAAFALAQTLRDAGIATELDHQYRSLRSQFRQADKSGAAMTAIIGPDELAANKVKLRLMDSHEEHELVPDELGAWVLGMGL